jgi:hypothetical protein
VSLHNDAQIILQSELPGGGMRCSGFTGLPMTNPALILLLHADSPAAEASAEALRQELEQEIGALDVKVRSFPLPCGGQAGDTFDSQAHLGSSCQRLLVLVGDASTPIPWRPCFAPWLTGDPLYVALPVLPRAAKPQVTGLLPKDFQEKNVQFWSSSIAEAVPAVLSLSGLTTERPRIFISYRQQEAPALAIQLFDALAHENFDLFLDHFRIPPGVNFQLQLRQELGDKGMVLLIESKGILDSKWTLEEINVAKACRLGIFALQPPDGKAVPGVDDDVRERLDGGDFEGGLFAPDSVLKPSVLADVVERIKREHDRALVRRRRVLRDSITKALEWEKCYNHHFDEYGVLHVTSALKYRVWVTPWPPELMDFHTTHCHCQAPLRGVVIGLSSLMEPSRRQRTEWLAGLCDIRLVDEGKMADAAAAMARGAL